VKPSQSAEALRRHLGSDPRRTPLYDLVAAAMSFYADEPAEGLAGDEDSDALLFQFGCYDWGEGERFEFDLTRQFVDADKTAAGAISQLRLTVYYPADDEFRALGRHNAWCAGRDKLAGFRQEVFGSDAFTLAAIRPRAKVEIEWGKNSG
jgi:hypothetical protein